MGEIREEARVCGDKGLVINYGEGGGGGLQNGKIAGPKLLVSHPLKTG